MRKISRQLNGYSKLCSEPLVGHQKEGGARFVKSSGGNRNPQLQVSLVCWNRSKTSIERPSRRKSPMGAPQEREPRGIRPLILPRPAAPYHASR